MSYSSKFEDIFTVPKSDSLTDSASAPHPIDRFDDRSQTPHFFDMITNLPKDWVVWTKQNVTLDHWPIMSALAISTAITLWTDRPTYTPFRKLYDQNATVHTISDDLVFMGDGKFQFGLAAAFGAYGLLFRNDRALRTASQTAEVIVACGAVVQLLKHLTGRESPFVATSETGVWRFFPNQIDYAKHVPHYDAFPSGHIATATATLIVIANNYPELTWLKPVGYVTLGAIATALVASGIHWWSDFPLGAALGYTFGMLISPKPEPETEAAGTGEGTGSSSVRPGTSSPSQFKSLEDHMFFYPVLRLDGAGIGMSIGF